MYVQVPRHRSIPLGWIKTSTAYILSGDGHVAAFKRFDRAAMTYSPHAMLDWDEVEAE